MMLRADLPSRTASMEHCLSLHHASVIVADLKRSLAFYCDVLGLRLDSSRPDLGFQGAWLTVGGQQVHLLELTNPRPVNEASFTMAEVPETQKQFSGDPVSGRPAHGGRDRHFALNIRSLDALRQTLDAAGVAYSLSKSGRRALFCRDPDGNALEFIEV